ncbi:hypothetical protein [Candidatus Stoquefichus massiliensis]|uniref:hypothetical protein n=1 Tax=Candidatus Stoquefichus massiliensis TaxID=1470350 RepID=UPI000481D007|nr:hypothetical protein [Candidatus Stoquefichus massiliensis]
MKYIMINDEHELYRAMMNDLFIQNIYDVVELQRMKIPSFLKKIYNLHYDDRINKRIPLPFKQIWYPFYELHKYDFDPNENYCVIFMNGSLRKHFEKDYLLQIKKKHANVKFALLIFDSSKYPGARRSYDLLALFDYKFSFDKNDCERYKLEYFYNCLSFPKNISEDTNKKSDAFFIGSGCGRINKLQEVFKKISNILPNCSFFITEVPLSKQEKIRGVTYNERLSFQEDLIRSYNTNCIIEILRDGQTGITLRTCEAIMFNKKLLTNNSFLSEMPFYDSRYMQIFEKTEDINIDFLLKKENVQYKNNNVFSPIRILERIEQLEKQKGVSND